MDAINVTKELSRFNKSKTVETLTKKYTTKSFFEIISKDTDEMIHSRILKWILELDNLPCEWNSYPIIYLLDAILERAIEQEKCNEIGDELREYILLRNAKIIVKRVLIEKPTSGVTLKYNGVKQTGRSDILVLCDIILANETKTLTICIENKIDTDEHDFQTWKYYAFLVGDKVNEEIKSIEGKVFDIDFEKNYIHPEEAGDYQLFVFLTPHSNLEMDELKNTNKISCSCPHYIHINYQDIMNHVLTKLQDMKGLDSRIKTLVSEYMNTLSIPFINNNRKHQIMAMTDEDSKLLNKFWEENKSLILASLYAFMNDGNQDEEARNQVQKATELLSGFHTFSISMDDILIEDLRMSDVAERVADYLLNKGYDSVSINKLVANAKKDFLIISTDYSKRIIDDNGKAKENEPFRWRQLTNNPNYYVTTQWSYNKTKSSNPNFPKFMDTINNSDKGLKITLLK